MKYKVTTKLMFVLEHKKWSVIRSSRNKFFPDQCKIGTQILTRLDCGSAETRRMGIVLTISV